MIWLKRIFLFMLTNFLILMMIGVVFTILSQVFGIHLGSYSGLFAWCAALGFGGSFTSLLMSKWMAKTMMGVQVIDPAQANPQMRDLVNVVHGLAAKAGIQQMPEVGIYDSPEINAFATGPSKNNSLVAVSTGLLQAMNRDEIEGVLGHEITHVANGDMVTLTLIQGVMNTFVYFLARVIASLVANSGDDRNRRGNPLVYFMITTLLDFALGLLAWMVVAYFSRRREYRADAGGARFAGREKMLAGLRKLQNQYQYLETDTSAVSAFKITSREGGFKALFASHPPLADRIRRLEEMKGV